MKRYSMGIWMSILVIGTSAAHALPGSTMYVAVKTVAVKASTDFFARDRGTLVYGNSVRVLQEQGKWVEIQAAEASLQGWIAASSLTSKRIIASGRRTSASVQELALAGKGFSEEAETLYRHEGRFDYDAIDAMETLHVSDLDLYTFLIDGHLAQGD
ncbi:MAG: hypothetical protein LBF75_07445 [Treponema sp.]|nr:hypothetical protein [Treponema sp.]